MKLDKDGLFIWFEVAYYNARKSQNSKDCLGMLVFTASLNEKKAISNSLSLTRKKNKIVGWITCFIVMHINRFYGNGEHMNIKQRRNNNNASLDNIEVIYMLFPAAKMVWSHTWGKSTSILILWQPTERKKENDVIP